MARRRIHPNLDVDRKPKGTGHAGLDEVITRVEKKHGSGAVMQMGRKPLPKVNFIPSASLTFDLTIGGFARGLITELWGPEGCGKSSFMLQTIAAAQAAGLRALFTDAEQALNFPYAKQLGVRMEDLLICQPNSGEEALDTLEDMIGSGAIDLAVFDSVAAIVPRAELDGEIGDSIMGVVPRLMGQFMRKVVSSGILRKSNTALVFINQIREKLGVTYGCFHYTARVLLADGSKMKIGKIVNQKIPAKVLSFNPRTGEITERRVTGWFDNGRATEFLQFTVEKPSGKPSRFGVTPNHLIFTPDGSQRAGNLNAGDMVLGMAPYRFSATQRSVAIGSILGDGGLRLRGSRSVALRIGHGPDQTEYCKWKQSIFGSLVSYRGKHVLGGWAFDVAPSYDLFRIYDDFYLSGGCTMPTSLIREIDPLAVAIWYMDDGSFGGSYKRWGHGKAYISMESYSPEDMERVATRLEEIGFPRPTVAARNRLMWSGLKCWKMQARIAKFIHPSMNYKLHPKLRGKFMPLSGGGVPVRYSMVPVRVLEVKQKPCKDHMERFDLQVEGGHSYLVDGVGVHNSTETQPGGRALKFTASLRVDMRRIAALKAGEKIIGARTKFKIPKSRVCAPYQDGEFDLIYGEGVNRAGEIVDLGVDLGVVEKSGSWYSHGGERLGAGRFKACAILRENTEWAERIEGEIREAWAKRAEGKPVEDSEAAVAGGNEE